MFWLFFSTPTTVTCMGRFCRFLFCPITDKPDLGSNDKHVWFSEIKRLFRKARLVTYHVLDDIWQITQASPAWPMALTSFLAASYSPKSLSVPPFSLILCNMHSLSDTHTVSFLWGLLNVGHSFCSRLQFSETTVMDNFIPVVFKSEVINTFTVYLSLC